MLAATITAPERTRSRLPLRPMAALLLWWTLTALSVLPRLVVAATDPTAESFHVHSFTVGSHRAQKNYPEARCNRPMDTQPVWPNTNATFKYYIQYGKAPGLRLRVPTSLLQHDYEAVTGQTKGNSDYTKDPVEARPTILAEFCSELPYLLYRTWPKKSDLDRNSDELFKVANHGCALLRTMFRAQDQHFATSPSCDASNDDMCQRITEPSSSYNIITRAVAHLITTFTDDLELRQDVTIAQPKAGTNPRDLPASKNLFQDKRRVDTVQVLETVRNSLIARVKKIAAMRNGPQVLGTISQVPPFAALGDVSSATFAQQSVRVFAKALTVFMLSMEAEMLAQRIRRSEETFPWTSQVHKIVSTFNLNYNDAANLAAAFDSTTQGHFSFDVSFPANPVKSMVAAIGGKGMEYTAGEANHCDLFNPVITTAINGQQWFHGPLAEGAVRLKNAGSAPMFTVNWFLPPAPKSTEDVTPRQARRALVDSVKSKSPVHMSIEVSTTTAVGSKACPNLPIIPLTIFPAYACVDSFKTCTHQSLFSQADAWTQDEYVSSSGFSAEDSSLTDDVDAMDDDVSDFSFTDELTMFMDEDGLDEAAYGLGDELFAQEDVESDFSLSEEDVADEEGADEADFSTEDALFADHSVDSYAASYADSSLFE